MVCRFLYIEGVRITGAGGRSVQAGNAPNPVGTVIKVLALQIKSSGRQQLHLFWTQKALIAACALC